MSFWKSSRKTIPTLPPGKRVYAIGDIHGEAALLLRLLRKICHDSERRGVMDTTLVILGDFIDRGDDAMELLKTFSRSTEDGIVILKGNHEAVLVEVYRGNEEALGFWLRFGGQSTLAGLGIPMADIQSEEPEAIIETLRARLDAGLVEWLDGLPTSWTIGDYLFVHAGIRPGLDLNRQMERDLLWIRDPFLSSRRDHGKVIVHGHTIETGEPRLGGNRIGLDTGAHEHGCLTALGLEADRQWLLQVDREQGTARSDALLPVEAGGKARQANGAS